MCLLFSAGCDPLEDPENGEVTVTGLERGATANYMCNPGYELIGPILRICDETFNWIPDVEPICRREHFRDCKFVIAHGLTISLQDCVQSCLILQMVEWN